MRSGFRIVVLFFLVIRVVLVLITLTVIIDILEIDRHIADRLYGWEGHSWSLKNAWVTAVLIHLGGKYFSILLLMIVCTLFLSSFLASSIRFSSFSSFCHFPSLRAWRLRLGYLLVAAILGSLSVSVGKAVSNISCPWDFARYGGTLEYLSLFEQLQVRNGSHCFPAGHASAGFAWVALYFVGLHTCSSWRWLALGFAVLLGVVFGISQQLRGAHFLSHDLWSFGVCWMVSLVCYQLILKPYESLQ